MIYVMKNVERYLRGSISILVLIRRRRRLGYCDHRAIRYAPRHCLNQSRFQSIPCVLSCSSRRCSYHPKWYLRLPLRLQSLQRHLQIRYHPLNWDLRYPHWNRPLCYLVDQQWELMKMCRKDRCCSGWLGPETLRVAITTSHCGTGHDVFSKSELRKKNSK